MASSITLRQNILIPMRDGIHLAGNLYCPPGSGPWPCLVNYLPYHKDGRGGLFYDPLHRFFAERGYASMVIDFRGLGCSEGINSIPFDSQEGRDGHDAVEWIAAQSWCDGNVGMWGSSYGGITALKTAAAQPPHLNAIVPVHATYCNYLDFLMLGGCRNGFWPNGDWGPRMIGYNLTPPLGPDPDGRLARLWAQRLEYSRPWCLDWYGSETTLSRRWAERAIAIEQITAPTLAVCGWKDFYVQGTFDYFNRLSAPKKLLMGPWKHAFPNLSPVEPVNLLELMVCWWDRWLRADKNGVEKGPALTLFVQGSGVWRQEESWPPRRNLAKEWYLLPDRTLASVPHTGPGIPDAIRYDCDPTVGLDSISFDPWTTAVLNPGTHDGDDGRSLVFTTEALQEDWEVTGQPKVILSVRTSVSGMNFTAKLCDVLPEGNSRLVTMGWSPDTAIDPGAAHPVEIPLRATSHVFRKGHRIRLSLALADFPRLWPTPKSGVLHLEIAPHNPPRLLLPNTPAQHPPLPAPQLPPPGPTLKSSFEAESTQSWTVSRELVQQTAALASAGKSRYQLRDGGAITYVHEYTAGVSVQAPADAAIHVKSRVEVDQPSGKVQVRTNCTFTPTTVTIHAEATQDGKIIWQKDWFV